MNIFPKASLLIIFALINLSLFSQNKSINSISIKGNNIWCDRFNNIYVLTNTSLEKFTPPYAKSINYVNYSLGFISGVNVNNPLKIGVYYEEFNKLVYLDQYLKELEIVDLNNINTSFNKIIVSPSNKGGLWIFNSKNFRLEYYSNNLKLKYSSPDLSTIYNFTILPNQLSEWESTIYLLIESNVLIFNNLGNYIKTLPLKNGSNHKIIEGKLYYMENDSLLVETNMQNFNKSKFPVSIDSRIIDYTINREYIFVLTKKNVYIYNINKYK